jgi:hypothetical protein
MPEGRPRRAGLESSLPVNLWRYLKRLDSVTAEEAVVRASGAVGLIEACLRRARFSSDGGGACP